MSMRCAAVALCFLALPLAARGEGPLPVGHRGLVRHAPENTLAAFAACLELRLGFELDVRRSKDGTLVCVHDDDVKRTTDGKGKVAELTLAQLKKLDAGRWFAPEFAGERVPTLEEALALVKARARPGTLVALDLKIDDGKVEADVAALVKKHGVAGKVVCIGTAIDSPAVRKRLRAANPLLQVAALAQTAKDLDKALAAKDADWAYVRFVPTKAEVARARKAGKKVLVVGPAVMGREPANWKKARDAGARAILTDYPLECRLSFRDKGK
jgi:glycerophosphoryl diester phosphodiesterase